MPDSKIHLLIINIKPNNYRREDGFTCKTDTILNCLRIRAADCHHDEIISLLQEA